MTNKNYLIIITFVLAMLVHSNIYASYPDTSIRTISVGSSPTSCAFADDYLFVANSFDNTVSVIDLAANSIVETIDVGGSPQNVIAGSDDSKIYVSNYDDNSISVISVATLTVASTISDVGDGPRGMCLSSAGGKLYVACDTSDSIVIISTAGDSKEAEIASVGDAPAYAAVSSSGEVLYVTLSGEASVVIVDITTNEVTDTKIAVGNSPHGIAITPNGNHLYVANSNSDSISVISTVNNSVIRTINNAGDGVREIAILSNGEYGFVTNSNSSNMTVIDILDDSIAATHTTESSPYGICASDDDKFIYVTNKGSNTVSVFEDQTVILIDGVDNQRVNNSGTVQIDWHTTESGTYQIEVGGDGNKDSGTVIYSGSVSALEQTLTDIVAATHLIQGDGAYKIYFYLTVAGSTVYSNFTTIVLDNIAPAKPLGLVSEFGDGKIFLSWDNSMESDFSGYKIYYGTATGTYDNFELIGTRNRYTLEGLTNGTRYYVAIAAADLAGNESILSDEVSEVPDKILSLSDLKGEEGCFIAEASYQKKYYKMKKAGFVEKVKEFIKRIHYTINLYQEINDK